MNLKIVLKLIFNYKITQTFWNKTPAPNNLDSDPSDSPCNSHLSGSGFLSAVTFLSACTLCQMLFRPPLSHTFLMVSSGTSRLGFLQIHDTLTLAITPNVMVPTVIWKIGMKLLITREAVSLLPAACEHSHFSDSKCPGVTCDPMYTGPISMSPAPPHLEFLSTHWPWCSHSRLQCHPRRW